MAIDLDPKRERRGQPRESGPELSNVCPECGRAGDITLERVLHGRDAVLTQCCCRSCGHVWRPASR